MKILTIIPARGGSKGIPRKNIRLLNGLPLISYSIKNALNSTFDMDVCVSTDDEEIANISRKYGAEIIKRSDELADDVVTLDPVIYDAYMKMKRTKKTEYDLIITLQATSPILSTTTLDSAINKINNNNIDSIISVTNKPHLSWTIDKNNKIIPAYKERVNRQYLPPHYTETGAFLITRSTSMSESNRLGEKVSTYEVPEMESIDIDTPADWWIAETELKKKNILIRVEGFSEIGLGHVYRGLSLAYGLIQHNVTFVISEKSDLGIDKLEKSFLPYKIINSDQEILEIIRQNKIDIIVNDMLDTDEEYIQKLKNTGVRIINFEDLGTGADFADATINDLYEKTREGNNYYWGSDYYIIRDEFIPMKPINVKDSVRTVMTLFGGVDPNNYTKKFIESIPHIKNSDELTFIIVVGPGYKYFDEIKKLTENMDYQIIVIRDVKEMTTVMSQADLAVSSQGRSMLEFASMGIPTIIMAQNKRELTHKFGELQNGFMNLGLGTEIGEKSLAATINWLVNVPEIRKQMHTLMLSKNLKNGLDKVINIILNE